MNPGGRTGGDAASVDTTSILTDAGGGGAAGSGGGGAGTATGSGGGGEAGSAGTAGSTGSGGAGTGGVAGPPATGGAPSTGGGGGAGGGAGTTPTGGMTAPSTGGSTGTGGRLSTGGSSTGGASSGGAGGRPGSGGTSSGGAPGTTGGASGSGGLGGAGGAGGRGGGGGAVLYVVAHPDDELLFMNPDLETDILAGKSVTTVSLTSGDGGDPNSDWRGREQRVMTAHAAMAGVANSWSCAAASYAAKATFRCVLMAQPAVKCVFFRVLDGGIGNLRALPASGTVGTIDSTGTYTRAQLLATLAAVQTELAPSHVAAMDGTLAHGPEHGDHIAAGIFTFDAARSDGISRQLTMYRGYTMFEPSFVMGAVPAPEPENLSMAQYQEKLRILLAYQMPPLDPDFNEWCHRLYPVRGVYPTTAGPLRTAAGQCLATTGTGEGAALTVAACNGSAAQSWTIAASGRITGQANRCLGLGSNGVTAVLEACNATATDQRWTLLSNGQLHGSGDSCLTLAGTSVTASLCGSDTSGARHLPLALQRWTP